MTKNLQSELLDFVLPCGTPLRNATVPQIRAAADNYRKQAEQAFQHADRA